MKKILNYIAISVLSTSALSVSAGEYCYGGLSDDCHSNSCCDNSSYLFAYGGVSFANDFTTEILNLVTLRNQLAGAGIPPATVNGITGREDFDLDTGFIVGGGIGVRSDFLCGTRFEIEGLFNQNDIESVTNGANTFTNLDGEISTAAVMFNFFKEVPLGCATGYFGGGFGLSSVESDLTLLGDTVSDSDFGFAHQFVVGADLPVADCLSLFVQYKLFNGGDVSLLCPSGVPGITKFAEFEGSYQSSVVMGARIHF